MERQIASAAVSPLNCLDNVARGGLVSQVADKLRAGLLYALRYEGNGNVERVKVRRGVRRSGTEAPAGVAR
jgi:hypothetical protein